jgi:Tfp pilus assembly protein PilN
MQKNSRPLMAVLAYPNKTLSQLCLQSSQQVALLEEIKAVLPDHVQSHALHCVAGAKTLSVYTDSANWATQLRFHSSAMLAVANARFSGNITTLRVKILLNFVSQEPKRQSLIPSQSTVAVLKSHSETVSDPQLKASLMRLSTTLTRLQKDKD